MNLRNAKLLSADTFLNQRKYAISEKVNLTSLNTIDYNLADILAQSLPAGKTIDDVYDLEKTEVRVLVKETNATSPLKDFYVQDQVVANYGISEDNHRVDVYNRSPDARDVWVRIAIYPKQTL